MIQQNLNFFFISGENLAVLDQLVNLLLIVAVLWYF